MGWRANGGGGLAGKGRTFSKKTYIRRFFRRRGYNLVSAKFGKLERKILVNIEKEKKIIIIYILRKTQNEGEKGGGVMGEQTWIAYWPTLPAPPRIRIHSSLGSGNAFGSGSGIRSPLKSPR